MRASYALAFACAMNARQPPREPPHPEEGARAPVSKDEEAAKAAVPKDEAAACPYASSRPTG